MHFCCDKLVDMAVFSKAKSCAEKIQPTENSSRKCSIGAKDCCSNKTFVKQGEDNLKKTNFEQNIHDLVFLHTFFYTYVNRVKRIFGNTVPAGSHRQDTHLLNVRSKLTEDWSVVGFVYLIDNEDQPSFSTQTFGLRFEGSAALAGGEVSLLGELARQSSAYNAPVDFDADFVQLQAIWSRGAWSFGAGFELLGSDNGQGFRTPLATLHRFNGWADKFLSTPGSGLQDTYLRFGYRQEHWNFSLRLHDFRADAGSENWGSEIDASASRKFGDRLSLLLKAARFDADSASFDDTTKLWLMLTAGF